MTRSGSGRAERWVIHDGVVWWDRANQERPMMEGPVSQGSSRMVYGFGFGFGCWWFGGRGVWSEL